MVMWVFISTSIVGGALDMFCDHYSTKRLTISECSCQRVISAGSGSLTDTKYIPSGAEMTSRPIDSFFRGVYTKGNIGGERVYNRHKVYPKWHCDDQSTNWFNISGCLYQRVISAESGSITDTKYIPSGAEMTSRPIDLLFQGVYTRE